MNMRYIELLYNLVGQSTRLYQVSTWVACLQLIVADNQISCTHVLTSTKQPIQCSNTTAMS